MEVTRKQRILDCLQGAPTDSIPWVPRLDLWYRANRRAGALPEKYGNCTLEQIVDDLGWGYHAVIPDFKDLRSPEDDAHRALGVYNLGCMPFRTEFENVHWEMRSDRDETIVRYHTPCGVVTTRSIYDESMRSAGITISHVSEYAIKGPEDYDAVRWLFDHARVIPVSGGYLEFARRVGDRGIAVAYLNSAGSPMHLLMRELMPPDLFFYEMHDHPEELRSCAESIGRYFERMFESAARCPAEVFLLGANYDAALTTPPFFAEHIAPWLRKFADRLHANGRFLLTHADGENSGLLDHYLDSRIDIADSICPSPMTRLSLRTVRDHFAGRVSIMGSIPSVCLLSQSMSEKDFRGYLDAMFSELGTADHLILGISDTTPPAADFERLRVVAAYIQDFGPVRPGRIQGGSTSGASAEAAGAGVSLEIRRPKNTIHEVSCERKRNPQK